MNTRQSRGGTARALLLTLLLLAPPSGVSAAGLWVYPPVKDKDGTTHSESRHFKVRVRVNKPGSSWTEVYAMRTVSKAAQPSQSSKGYFEHLGGWTHTYVNFETDTDDGVVVEITDRNGYAISEAAVHPARHGTLKKGLSGAIEVTLPKACMVAVDVHGQMDKQDTGVGYKGDPIHTISIFANPPLAGKPAEASGSGVRYVKPGQKPDLTGNWTTLYFQPGVHDVGLAFPLRANCNYYIPGDAIVYGTFNSDPRTAAQKAADAVKTIKPAAACSNIRIFGHGTLSGAKLTHPMHLPGVSRSDDNLYNPIRVDRSSVTESGAANVHVEGITVADSANHSVQIRNYKRDASGECSVKWTKVFTWRVNGDGIGPWANTRVEDCFIRTQDDSMYVAGLGIQRCVLWNDANGSSFMMGKMPDVSEGAVVVQDCDVIYSRRAIGGPGGRVFSIRGDDDAPATANVTIKNINIEDPRPTYPPFFLCMALPDRYLDQDKDGKYIPHQSRDGNLSGITFENIKIAAPSVLKDEKQWIWGHEGSSITKLQFKNVTIKDNPDPKKPARLMTKGDFSTQFVDDWTISEK
jgi:hypothetical protein